MSGRVDVLVLGGGLAGMAAAHTLARAGQRIAVVERESEVGGLAKSRTHVSESGRFDYDIGPHRFHTTDARVRDEVVALLGLNAVEAERLSRIFLYRRFFNYPLQAGNVLRNLPKLVLLRAFADYFAVKLRNIVARRPDSNFENWVVNRFGRTLYRVFFGTYTEKTWGMPCSLISADWASQRITLLSLWDTVKKTLFRPKNVPRTYVSAFRYPRTGGIGTIARRYREEVEKAGSEVLTDHEVREVRVVGGSVSGALVAGPSGERFIAADRVLSTIPVTVLARVLRPEPPPEVLESVGRLKYRSMVFVFLVLDRPSLTRDNWIYLPERSITVHRISEFKNFSPDAAPAGRTLICAEITCDLGDAVWSRTDAELRAICIDDLSRMGLLRPEEALESFVHREQYAYPIYDLAYRRNRDLVLNHVDSIQGLDTTGRQGLFKYNNMDHSIGMGLAAADNLMGVGESHRKVATGQEYFG